MKISKYNIPSVMLDNDLQMLNLLFKVVAKVDEDAEIQVHKTLKGYMLQVTPSKIKHKKFLLMELQELSLILGDIFEFSKTVHISKQIIFYTK